MRFLYVVLLITLCFQSKFVNSQIEFEDNDFADFDDFGDDEPMVSTQSTGGNGVGGGAGGIDESYKEPVPVNHDLQEKLSVKPISKPDNDDFHDIYEDIDNDDDEDDAVVEDDGDFEHFADDELFENFNKADEKNKLNVDQKAGEPKLTMAQVPLHFRTHWDSYWMEMVMLAGLLAYFANYFIGKNKNTKIANKWLQSHRSLLEDNFVLVGDDGKIENECPGLMKESDSLFTLWCSGRSCCEGMLVELKMIRRQDLMAILSDILRPTLDQIQFKVELSKDVMDSFVFCLGTRRTASKLFKELNDLNKYCTLVSKAEDKYKVPNGFSVLSEIPEATSAMLDSRVLAAINKYENMIDYIHISDQYSGQIQQEDSTVLKQPEVKRILYAGFNLPLRHHNMDDVKPLLVLVFYIIERLKRYRLSKEGKSKADKNRARVEEEFLKSTHSARAEAAAVRREEKRKQEKERVLAEDDPEKQRRWEKKEQKRQQKKKAPKMKSLSIKAL